MFYLSCSNTETCQHWMIEVSKDHYCHHHVMLLAWISLTLSHHSSLSSIASGRSSGRSSVSIQSSRRWVLAGRPTLARSCEGFHRKTLLMSLFLLCLVHLIWIVLEMGGRWPYSCCFVGCCFQNLFNMTFCILVQFLFRFSYINLFGIHMVGLTWPLWKNCILFYQIGLISIWLIIYQ